AEEHFRDAITIESGYTEARNNLGRLLIERQKYKEAETQLKTVTNDLKYQTPEKGHTNLGLLFLKTNRLPEAREQFLKALRLNRKFCEAHNLLGQTLFLENRFSKASEALDRAISVCEKYDEPHYYSALSYARSGQKAKAIARLKELMQLYPSSSYIAESKKLLAELRNDD
ncbi:MAG: tetratricopeptide repeat protein, partial [Bdellovibrionales bacterium]|nr:tetratricopeptide repeat protein [Bdellovibrionales bacterium]